MENSDWDALTVEHIFAVCAESVSEGCPGKRTPIREPIESEDSAISDSGQRAM